jgi:transcription termination factor Rho
MLLPELKQMAGGLGIKGVAGMRKSQLIDAIKAAQSGGQADPRAGKESSPPASNPASNEAGSHSGGQAGAPEAVPAAVPVSSASVQTESAPATGERAEQPSSVTATAAATVAADGTSRSR